MTRLTLKKHWINTILLFILEGEAWSAGALNMGRCIKGYSDVLPLDIDPSGSFTRHELPALLGTPLVDGHIELGHKKLVNVQEAMYSLVPPASHGLWRPGMVRLNAFFIRMVFFDWGLGGVGFGHKVPSPAGVLTAELSALFTALRHIAEVIQPPERCLILIDSLCSIKAV
jgi:hypothetical protein